MESTQRKQKISLFILTIVILMGFLGISLPYPILAPMIVENTYPLKSLIFYDLAKPVLLGMVLASYPLGQLIGAFVLGSLSDTISRKKVLAFSLLGAATGYVFSALSIYLHSYELLLLTRLFTGFFEGNIAVAQAAISDLSNESEQIDKAYGFSWLNFGIALGFVLGPIIGGVLVEVDFLGEKGYPLPFILGMILSLITFLLVRCYFYGSALDADKDKYKNDFLLGIQKTIQSFTSDLRTVLIVSNVRTSIIIYVLIFIGIDFFYEFYPFYFVGMWSLEPWGIAYYSAVYTVPYSISQLIIVPWISKKTDAMKILLFACGISGIFLMLMLAPKTPQGLYFVLPILGISISFCSTNTAILLSDSAGNDIQGKAFGLVNSLRMFNITWIALIGGVVGSLNVGFPILAAAGILLLVLIIILSKNYYNFEVVNK